MFKFRKSEEYKKLNVLGKIAAEIICPPVYLAGTIVGFFKGLYESFNTDGH